MSTIKINPVVTVWNCKACKVSEQTANVWSCAPNCLNCGLDMQYVGIVELLTIEIAATEQATEQAIKN